MWVFTFHSLLQLFIPALETCFWHQSLHTGTRPKTRWQISGIPQETLASESITLRYQHHLGEPSQNRYIHIPIINIITFWNWSLNGSVICNISLFIFLYFSFRYSQMNLISNTDLYICPTMYSCRFDKLYITHVYLTNQRFVTILIADFRVNVPMKWQTDLNNRHGLEICLRMWFSINICRWSLIIE